MKLTNRAILMLVLVLAPGACRSAAPFSVPTPGLETLSQEEPYLYANASEARNALAGVPLRGRIQNFMDTYEAERVRARGAQGGMLNATLSVLGILLPISGTVSAIALSNPDDIQTVSIVTGAATTAVLALKLLLKPEAKAAAAARCESFLDAALESSRQRWRPDRLEAVTGEAEDWERYLAVRGALEPVRLASCGG